MRSPPVLPLSAICTRLQHLFENAAHSSRPLCHLPLPYVHLPQLHPCTVSHPAALHHPPSERLHPRTPFWCLPASQLDPCSPALMPGHPPTHSCNLPAVAYQPSAALTLVQYLTLLSCPAALPCCPPTRCLHPRIPLMLLPPPPGWAPNGGPPGLPPPPAPQPLSHPLLQPHGPTSCWPITAGLQTMGLLDAQRPPDVHLGAMVVHQRDGAAVPVLRLLPRANPAGNGRGACLPLFHLSCPWICPLSCRPLASDASAASHSIPTSSDNSPSCLSGSRECHIAHSTQTTVPGSVQPACTILTTAAKPPRLVNATHLPTSHHHFCFGLLLAPAGHDHE